MEFDLMQQFRAGGFFMNFIAFFGVLVLGFIIERGIALFVQFKRAPKDFRKQLLSHICKNDFKSAQAHIEMAAPKSSLGKIAMIGCAVRACGGGEEELQARMDEKLTLEIGHIDKRTNFLAVFGNVATLLGLLGTVTGLIISFSSITDANPAERAIMLSKGISEALNSTAFGLVVAVPALIAFAIYQNKTERIVNELTEKASEIYHDLLFYSESDPVEYDDLPDYVKTDSKATKATSTEVRN
jgi:biopolymer transport protein ExbB/TolQ